MSWTSKEIAYNHNLINRVKNRKIKKCSYCGLYYNIEDFQKKYIYKSKLIYNLCNNCIERLNNNKYIIIKDEKTYKDYL